jgi:hypothetical protein
MRALIETSFVGVAAVVGAVALVGCSRNQGSLALEIAWRGSATQARTPGADAPVCVATVMPGADDVAPRSAESLGVTSMQGPSTGSRTSNVGTPFPLPSVTVEVQPPVSRSAPAPSPPFAGTTFREETSTDWESSFGPDAGL